MSLSVSDRLARVQPSATGAVLARATELIREGRSIVRLGAGEPDFDTPEFIKAAAIEAIRRGETRYTPVGGDADLKAAIVDKFRRDNELDFSPAEVLVSGGAKQSLFNLCLAVLGPGDEAIVPAPYWVSYPEMVRLADATPIIVEASMAQGFKMGPADLEAALSPRTRLVFLNSPGNPTGSAYSAAELQALGEILESHPNILVVSDDIYEHIYWGSTPYTTFAAACPHLRARSITVNGVSKAYAMTGWRIGYAAGPEWLISAMTTVQSQSTSNACSVSQAAAMAALNGDQSVVRAMCEAYRERHDVLVAGLNAIEGVECREGDGTFYAFPSVHGVMDRLGVADDIALATQLLEHEGVACVPGTAFGAPGHLRFSFACSLEDLGEGLVRLKRALAA